MTCTFLRSHCYKVILAILALMVVLEYGLGVLYEENRRMNQVYFTFNLSLPVFSSSSAEEAAAAGSWVGHQRAANYAITRNMTLLAIQGTNASADAFSLSILAAADDSGNSTKLNASAIKPPKCPIVSPLLVGKTNVSKKALPLSEIEQLYRDRLEPGGRFRPANCRANYKVAIVIPYRDRQEHLSVFLQHMHPFLQRQQLDYGIYVVQQSGDTPFNRAMLMNIGAAEALRQDNFECFVFHDVDLIPEDDRNIYSCPEQPRHMSVAIDTFKYKLPYDGLFGGVSAMSRDHFIKVNGFSNLFWGWGGEDDDMANRIKYRKLIISRYPATIARYTMLSHKKAKPNPNRYRIMRNGAKRSKYDGLSNLKYRRLDLQLRSLFTDIIVDIRP